MIFLEITHSLIEISSCFKWWVINVHCMWSLPLVVNNYTLCNFGTVVHRWVIQVTYTTCFKLCSYGFVDEKISILVNAVQKCLWNLFVALNLLYSLEDTCARWPNAAQLLDLKRVFNSLLLSWKNCCCLICMIEERWKYTSYPA